MTYSTAVTRKELALSGVDPFSLLEETLADNARLREQVQRLTRLVTLKTGAGLPQP